VRGIFLYPSINRVKIIAVQKLLSLDFIYLRQIIFYKITSFLTSHVEILFHFLISRIPASSEKIFFQWGFILKSQSALCNPSMPKPVLYPDPPFIALRIKNRSWPSLTNWWSGTLRQNSMTRCPLRDLYAKLPDTPIAWPQSLLYGKRWPGSLFAS